MSPIWGPSVVYYVDDEGHYDGISPYDFSELILYRCLAAGQIDEAQFFDLDTHESRCRGDLSSQADLLADGFDRATDFGVVSPTRQRDTLQHSRQLDCSGREGRVFTRSQDKAGPARIAAGIHWTTGELCADASFSPQWPLDKDNITHSRSLFEKDLERCRVLWRGLTRIQRDRGAVAAALVNKARLAQTSQCRGRQDQEQKEHGLPDLQPATREEETFESE